MKDCAENPRYPAGRRIAGDEVVAKRAGSFRLQCGISLLRNLLFGGRVGETDWVGQEIF